MQADVFFPQSKTQNFQILSKTYSRPIRSQNSLIINTFGNKNQCLRFFAVINWIQRKRTCVFLIYYIFLEIINQNLLSSNQITGFFNHQYLWNEKVNLLGFLHKDSYEGKIISKTTTVGWVWLGVPNHDQNSLTLSEVNFDYYVEGMQESSNSIEGMWGLSNSVKGMQGSSNSVKGM